MERKSWLKILGKTLENVPDRWGLHFDEMIGGAGGRNVYIKSMQVLYGMPMYQLNLLFNSLIMSLFIYGIELWEVRTLTKSINFLTVLIEMVK